MFVVVVAIPQIQNASIEAVIQQAALAQDSDSIAAATAGAIALGRVYTATSLPSHIWSLNGEFLLCIFWFLPLFFCFPSWAVGGDGFQHSNISWRDDISIHKKKIHICMEAWEK